MRTLLLVALSLGVAGHSDGQDWSRFRGPNGSGIAGDTGYPTEFGPDRNLVWRSAVRPGKSSPVLGRRHIFLTAFDQGTLYTQCFDRETGRLVWERAEQPVRHEDAHILNEPSAATPVTDGDNVYVFFRDLGVISYDATGAVRWKRPMGPFTNRMGAVASPIIAGSSLVLVLDQIERSSIVALSLATGEVTVGRLREAKPMPGRRRALRARPAPHAAGGDGRCGPVRRARPGDRRAPVVAQRSRAGDRRQPGHGRRHAGRLRLRLRFDAAVFRGAGQKRQGQGRPALARGVRRPARG